LASRPYGFLHCKQLLAALSHVRNSIEQLIVVPHLSNYDREDPFNTGIYGTLDLSSFDKLKTLEAPWALLLGWSPKDGLEFADVLPRNIEHLTINDHLWAFFHDIFDWEDDALLEDRDLALRLEVMYKYSSP
jgi:hypothetical protein